MELERGGFQQEDLPVSSLLLGDVGQQRAEYPEGEAKENSPSVEMEFVQYLISKYFAFICVGMCVCVHAHICRCGTVQIWVLRIKLGLLG